MNKRHYEHTLPNIRGSLSNTYLTPRSPPPIRRIPPRVTRLPYCPRRRRILIFR
ncbi:hypothetical protein [Parabacteroides distasonis]